MKIGNININNLKLGTTQINKVYLGVILIWSGIQGLIDAFKERVLSDGAKFEAETCLNSQLTNPIFLDEATLSLTPNTYKETKIYSIITLLVIKYSHLHFVN